MLLVNRKQEIQMLTNQLLCLGERNQTGYTTLLEQEKIKFKMAYPYGQVTMFNVLWIKLQMVFDVFHYNQQ